MWKTIRLLYFSVIGGTLFFLIFVTLGRDFLQIEVQYDQNLINILNTVGIVVTFIAYFAVRYIDKTLLSKINFEESAKKKLNTYKNVFFVELVVLNFAADLVIVFFLLTDSYLSLTGLILSIGYMILMRPDIYKTADFLKIEVSEIQQIPNEQK